MLLVLVVCFYGDVFLYLFIVVVNGIVDFGVIDVGQVLVIFIGCSDGFGLRIVDCNENDFCLWYYWFQIFVIGWNFGVNVLFFDDYCISGCIYFVFYLFYGGGIDQDFCMFDFLGICDLIVGKLIIIVMFDGGYVGWYFNLVSLFVGLWNWEIFYIVQLFFWIEVNF